ncbi:MAG: Peptidase family M48 [Candidatus Dependentiae bacterium ADurb.Bin331]|nr:MAG: Peptidase family M48 [Candidatus Dependentiae bacterium ADurb.Bin331]
MNARRSTLIILFSIVSIHTIDASCPFYNVIFGNEDVSVSYKKQITNALRDFNVPQPEKVAVKKMNSVAARLLGNELYSFTLIGIWLNEPALNTLTESAREFKLYHEAAHYAHKHHAQALGLAATALPLMTTFPLLFRSAYYHSAYKKLGNIFAYSATALSWYGLYSYALKPFIKEQEKQADLAAARMLCAKGKKEIVEAYLNQLKNQLADFSSDDWHYSQAEEYEYLAQLFAT